MRAMQEKQKREAYNNIMSAFFNEQYEKHPCSYSELRRRSGLTRTRFYLRLKDLVKCGAIEKKGELYFYRKPPVRMMGETRDAIRVYYNSKGIIGLEEGEIVKKGKGFSLKESYGKTTYFRRKKK